MITPTFSSALKQPYSNNRVHNNAVARFFTWCEKQEPKRLMWTGIMLPVQACILAPLTMVIAMLAGVNFMLFIPVISAIVLTFITNLAALPTKVTIPVFLFGILMDLGVIAAAFVMGIEPSRLFG